MALRSCVGPRGVPWELLVEFGFWFPPCVAPEDPGTPPEPEPCWVVCGGARSTRWITFPSTSRQRWMNRDKYRRVTRLHREYYSKAQAELTEKRCSFTLQFDRISFIWNRIHKMSKGLETAVLCKSTHCTLLGFSHPEVLCPDKSVFVCQQEFQQRVICAPWTLSRSSTKQNEKLLIQKKIGRQWTSVFIRCRMTCSSP